MSGMERTLIILKPDAVARGLVGEIISRFEKAGLKILGAKMITPTKELANKHYPTDRREFIEGMGHKSLKNYEQEGIDPHEHLGTNDPHEIGLQIQSWMVDFITSGPVMAMVLEGPQAIAKVREMAGHTIPAIAEPGTIRGDHSNDSPTIANKEKRPIMNLIHASGDKAEAEFEINLWFSDSELHPQS